MKVFTACVCRYNMQILHFVQLLLFIQKYAQWRWTNVELAMNFQDLAGSPKKLFGSSQLSCQVNKCILVNCYSYSRTAFRIRKCVMSWMDWFFRNQPKCALQTQNHCVNCRNRWKIGFVPTIRTNILHSQLYWPLSTSFQIILFVHLLIFTSYEASYGL